MYCGAWQGLSDRDSGAEVETEGQDERMEGAGWSERVQGKVHTTERRGLQEWGGRDRVGREKGKEGVEV